MKKDNLPLRDHSPITGEKLEIIILFQLGNQDENYFHIKRRQFQATHLSSSDEMVLYKATLNAWSAIYRNFQNKLCPITA